MAKTGMGIAASISLVWLCSVAPLGAILIPLLLPAFKDALGLGAGEMGMLASADLVGACLSAITAPVWLRRLGGRGGIVCGLVLVVAANAGATVAALPALLLATRLLAGIGMGMVLATALPLVAATGRPARLVSAIQLAQLLAASAALPLAGHLLAAQGLGPVLIAVVAVSVLSLPTVLLIPDSVESGHSLPKFSEIRPLTGLLGGIFLFFAGVGVLTNFAGQLSTQHGLEIDAVSTALALGNLGALPGSLIAMLVNRAEHLRPMLIGAVAVQCIAVGAMVALPGYWAFTAAFFLFQVCVTVLTPLQVAALVNRDASGRGIEYLAAMQSVGQALGPLIGALFITTERVDGAYVFGIAVTLVSLAMIVRRRFETPPVAASRSA